MDASELQSKFGPFYSQSLMETSTSLDDGLSNVLLLPWKRELASLATYISSFWVILASEDESVYHNPWKKQSDSQRQEQLNILMNAKEGDCRLENFEETTRTLLMALKDASQESPSEDQRQLTALIEHVETQVAKKLAKLKLMTPATVPWEVTMVNQLYATVVRKVVFWARPDSHKITLRSSKIDRDSVFAISLGKNRDRYALNPTERNQRLFFNKLDRGLVRRWDYSGALKREIQLTQDKLFAAALLAKVGDGEWPP